MSSPTAAGNLKRIHSRIAGILDHVGVLTPEQLAELNTLGSLALQMDDVKYRRAHTTGAMSPAQEKASRKNLKKAKKR